MKRISLLFIALIFYCSPAFSAIPSLTQERFQGDLCTPDCVFSFTSLPAIGSKVIMGITGSAGSTYATELSSCTDNQSPANTYVVNFTDANTTNFPSNTFVGIASTKVAHSAGTFTITCTLSQNSYVDDFIHEWANLDNTTWFDGVTGGTLGFTTSITITRGGANTTNNAVVYALMGQNPGDAGGTPATGYNAIFNDTSGIPGNYAAYKIVGTIETSSAAWTGFTAGFGNGAVAVYRGIDGGGGTSCTGGLLLRGAGGRC